MEISIIEVIRYYMSCNDASDDKDFAFVFHYVNLMEDKKVKYA